MSDVINHFKKVDPKLYAVAKRVKTRSLAVTQNAFADLVEIIIGQQLSEKAADTLIGRFRGLFPTPFTPELVASMPVQTIRGAGISTSKSMYIKGLAQAVVEGNVNLSVVSMLSNKEIYDLLIKLKGIGPWTVEMFLMFSLAREDIFSHGDLGLRKAMQRIYKLKDNSTKEEIESISNKWSPYRTYACLVLWKSLELKDIDI